MTAPADVRGARGSPRIRARRIRGRRGLGLGRVPISHRPYVSAASVSIVLEAAVPAASSAPHHGLSPLSQLAPHLLRIPLPGAEASPSPTTVSLLPWRRRVVMRMHELRQRCSTSLDARSAVCKVVVMYCISQRFMVTSKSTKAGSATTMPLALPSRDRNVIQVRCYTNKKCGYFLKKQGKEVQLPFQKDLHESARDVQSSLNKVKVMSQPMKNLSLSCIYSVLRQTMSWRIDCKTSVCLP